MVPRILSTYTLLPEFRYTAAEAQEIYQNWVAGQSEAFKRKAGRIFSAAAIEDKHSIAPAEVLMKKRTLDQSNGLYCEKAIELGGKLLKTSLEKTGLLPEQLDLLITTSCTGFMIPALDAYLINQLGLRPNLRKLPVTEIGCGAGVAGLVYAADFLCSYPDKHAAVLSVEFPSNTMQPDNFSWDNVVGTAIFADGLGCTLLGPGSLKDPALVDVEMWQLPDSTEVLGYNLTQSGFVMNLNQKLPDIIAENFLPCVEPFLKRNGLTVADVDHFLVHPGGLKILEKISTVLAPFHKTLDLSQALMKRHGNLSSATIHFIMQACFESQVIAPANALVVSYGPGFSTFLALLKWE